MKEKNDNFSVNQVDESLRAEDVEIYYDPAEPFGGVLNGFHPIAGGILIYCRKYFESAFLLTDFYRYNFK
ncbi:hypothetical protein WN944_014286 [Citrus x changshan-huyou]|uniref:Uncharacterized protein n=1 Tax=Citrus x changshan-huyou TaxID=2935761 RepID=A0AAP0QLG0_9ROSI